MEPESPAATAGLKKNQKIVEVNGTNVSDMSHREIATLIKENENNLVIGVVDKGENYIATKSSSSVVPKVIDENTKVAVIEKPEINNGTQSLSSASGQKLSGTFSSFINFN